MKMMPLGELGQINPAWSRAALPDDHVSFVGMAQMDDRLGSVTGEETKTVASVRSGYTPFEPGDILIAKITPCFQNRKIGQANIKHQWGAGSTEFHVFRPGPDLDARYALHFLRRLQFIISGELRMTGSGGQRRVPANYVATTQIPLPPLDEQRRIAAILDKAEALRTKRCRHLERLELLKTSVFNAMFLKGTAAATLGEICNGRFRNGVSPSTRGTVIADVLTLSAVTGPSFNAAAFKSSTFDRPFGESSRVRRELFLVCRGNGNRSLVGRGYFPLKDMDNVGFPDTMIAAEPNFDRISREYLEAAWSLPSTRSQIEKAAKTTNGIFKINQSSLSGIEIPLPPMHQQQHFATRVKTMNALRVRSTNQLEAASLLFTTLQHRAFAGEL